MRKILIVTHSYSPLLNPRAFRWSALAEHWARHGYRVDVVCAWVPPLSRAEMRNGVSVVRVGGAMLERLRKVFLSSRSHPNVESKSTSTEATVARASALRDSVRWLHDRTWKRLYWPDYACLWRRSAAPVAARLLDQQKHDLLISVSDPFTSHLVALSIKKRNSSLPWIADIGDPFSFRVDGPPNNYALYSRRNRVAEAEIFARADVVSVTCEGIARAYAQLYTECREKVKVIPPLLPPRIEMAASERVFGGDGVYNVLFVGTLYRKFRNPTFLLRLFEVLRQASAHKMRLHFVGSLNDCGGCFHPYKLHLGDTILLHGLRGREFVGRAIDSADLLVNIANNNPYQLPSKLVEYVQSGKPILNITRSLDDAATEFLRSYPRVLNIEERSPSPSASQIRSVQEFSESPPRNADPSATAKWLESFTLERVAHAYIESRSESHQESQCSPS